MRNALKLTALVLIAGFVLTTWGCSKIKGVNDKKSGNYIRISAGEANMSSDVLSHDPPDIGDPFFASDSIQLTVENRPKGDSETFPSDQAPGLLDVTLEYMRVSFVRTDGGEASPLPFTTGISGIVEVQNNADILVNVVPVLWKQSPPLRYLILDPRFNEPGYCPETGQSEIYGYLIIEVFGKNFAGDGVQAKTRVGVRFADFKDE
jgi:hypothetical protein